MNRYWKKICCCFVLLTVLCGTTVLAESESQVDADVSAQLVTSEAAILMEAGSGQVLYEYNADARLPIASVTKTMTMLLIMEALDSGKIQLTDMVSTSEYAASMGGSQVFLEPGEQMSVDDMLKAIAVASGNDAAVAMAEFISGTESAFVEKMNKRVQELGAENTHFINCNGLDETAEHYSTARDVALISCELLKHEKIQDYLTIWMDTLRDGKFQLANTNKLIRYYSGANGIKTGSTSVAKYCLSASAKRDNMQLVAVVLAAPTTAERFGSATKLLDYGFANYSVVDESVLNEPLAPVKVVGGTQETAEVEIKGPVNFIVKKGNQNKVEKQINIQSEMKAPASAGQSVGEIIFTIDGVEVARREVVTKTEVPRITTIKMFLRVLNEWLKVS